MKIPRENAKIAKVRHVENVSAVVDAAFQLAIRARPKQISRSKPAEPLGPARGLMLNPGGFFFLMHLLVSERKPVSPYLPVDLVVATATGITVGFLSL